MKRLTILTTSIFIFFFLLQLPVNVSAQGLTAEDIVSIKSVGSVEMSPDGNHIAYTLSVPRTAEDAIGRNYSELYIIPENGAHTIPIIEKPNSASSPQWGDDGRLYFLSQIEDHHDQTQVFSVNRSGNDLQMHTSAEHGLTAYARSRDGSALAYTAMEPVSDERQERIDQGFDMIVAGENKRYMRLWVQPENGNAEIITPEEVYVWDFSWAPDGEKLSVRISDEPGADQGEMYTRIATINKDGSGLMELMSSPKKKTTMSWSPDGQKLAMLAGKVYSDPIAQRIWTVQADGSNKRDITPENWEGTPVWIDWLDNETLFFNAVERSITQLYTLHTETNNVELVAGGDSEIFNTLSFDNRNRTFATSANTATHPGEVFKMDLRNGDFERLTHHNEWLTEIEFGEQSSITWKGADDLEVEGILVKPVGYEEGTRYPLAILPHGGPEGISMNGWNTRALYPVQLLANEGYVVFKPNYRGSGGRGTDFASANHRDLGGKEFDDVLLGIDYLDELGLIDPNRVGITGTSYGGYFAAWAATRYSDRFAAGITFAGLSNWISFMGTTDIPHEMSVVHWDLYWFDNPGQNWERSPVAWLNQANTPLLVATGLADERVHPEQSIQLHQFLKMRDIPTGLVLYPRQPHGLTERAHQLDFMERVLDWFEEYLK